MKKPYILLICLVILLLMAACDNTPSDTTRDETSINTTPSTTAASATASSTAAPSETSAETFESTTTESIPSETAEITTTESSTTTSTTTVPMYSSYAHMVSYDPARDFADFDYFNLLKGQDAIDYLVDHEGYTRTDAEALVNDFADSEFIEQNDNPLFRTIDLRDIDLKLMYHPDGTMVTDATPIDSELIDLYNLYHVNPDLVLNSFFYQVHVSGDIVTMVEQVYWP